MSRATTSRARISGGAASIPTTSRPSRPSSVTCSRQAGTPSSIGFSRRMATIAGSPMSCALSTTRAQVERLLASSPAVIYSFKAMGDFGPTFVSQNIADWLGYEPSDYLESPDFWRRCVHPDDLACVEAEFGHLFKTGRHTVEYRFLKKDGNYCWVTDELRLVYDKSAGRAPARLIAGGNLQLQSHGRLWADVRQSEYRGLAGL